MQKLSGLFVHRGYNYKTDLYDIGVNDNKTCKEFKEMFNKNKIVMANNAIDQLCPAYFETFDDIHTLSSDYVNTERFSTNCVHHNSYFSVDIKNDKVTIKNNYPDESGIILLKSKIPIYYY